MSRIENIEVSMRFRPLNSREKEESDHCIWDVSNNTVSLKADWANFLFDQRRLTGIPKCYNYSKN